MKNHPYEDNIISLCFKIIFTHLKTVKARQVSVTAYQLRSMRCSNSAALNWPKNSFLINLPVKITSTRDCKSRSQAMAINSEESHLEVNDGHARIRLGDVDDARVKLLTLNPGVGQYQGGQAHRGGC